MLRNSEEDSCKYSKRFHDARNTSAYDGLNVPGGILYEAITGPHILLFNGLIKFLLPSFFFLETRSNASLVCCFLQKRY